VNTQQLFDELYDEYHTIVLGRCVNYLGSLRDAQDVAQNIWVKVHFGLKKFRHECKPSTWLFTITTRECINFLKKRKYFVELDDPEQYKIIDKKSEIKSNTFARDNNVTKMLESVSQDMKVLLFMKYHDGYSYREIAALTDMSVSALKMRISRVKVYLQKAFQDVYGE